MAKPDHTWIGNSCHIHASLWRDRTNVFGVDDEAFGGFLAGQLACTRELALFFAPNINSYKRYAAGSWAPTTLAWGHDNRTCGFRIVGHGDGKRVETRIPGGDVNPYLAFAAMIAAGLHGLDQRLELPAALEGNAYESGAERFPSTLREAIDSLASGAVARGAFGADVVEHYLNYARVEQRLFDEAVTCYERERLFERG
jgi:glutamine synthetase